MTGHKPFRKTQLCPGMAQLLQAYNYAKDVGSEVWDFALEIDKLYEAGLTVSDLRWLVAKGFARHGLETSVYGDAHRLFHEASGINFVPKTCLVLTEAGADFAEQVVSPLPDSSAANSSDMTALALKPHWNHQLHELRLADMIVKRFRVPARNQEQILCAFEEEDWPMHIDDPLPRRDDIDPRTRLHDTINRLNGHQLRPLLRFHGNGHGTGITWKLRLHPSMSPAIP